MPGQNAVSALLQQYLPALNSHNEIAAGNNSIKPEWDAFFSSFRDLGFDEIQNRTTDILRLLKENGVAYNIYNDPSGITAPGSLTLFPN